MSESNEKAERCAWMKRAAEYLRAAAKDNAGRLPGSEGYRPGTPIGCLETAADFLMAAWQDNQG